MHYIYYIIFRILTFKLNITIMYLMVLNYTRLENENKSNKEPKMQSLS